MIDPVTAECIRIRELISERAGSFDAYFDQLEEYDRKRLAEDAAKKEKAKKARAQAKKAPKKRADK